MKTLAPAAERQSPQDRFAPIEFRQFGDGALVARLGALDLGAVRPSPLGCRTIAYWSSALPGGPRMRPASSLAAGRERLAEHIRDWFAACNHPLPFIEDP